jgi:hypothetical protein
MARRGIQGKPMGPVASNMLLESDAELYRGWNWRVGGEEVSGLTGFRDAFRR